jgi:ubiquinone/menaquinone biosynthesis C-methylase UbiE
MGRILDLGCGTGDSWRNFGLQADFGAQKKDWQVVGIDVGRDRLKAAHVKYGGSGWRFACARGESIPLPDSSIHGVISQGALPYMHIPRTLAELHRVLVPGGWLKLTLHPPRFTWEELRRSLPRPKASLFRTFVFLNGVVLHVSGRVLSIGPVAESCQTERGMRVALHRAGFAAVSFLRERRKFLVEAKRG